MTNFHHDIVHLYPELFLSLWGMIALLIGVFEKRKERASVHYLGMAGFAVTAVILLISESGGQNIVFNHLVEVNRYTQTLKLLVVLVMLATLFMTEKHFNRAHMNRFEVSVLMSFATVGMMLMISAYDFMTAFIGIELQALCFYVLVAIARDRTPSSEAGVKFFTLGALSTCFFLLGASYIYGFTGTTEFLGVKMALAQQETPSFILEFALFMVMVALCFKVTLVPFHMWTPDVYEGSPMPVTAMIAAAPKIAGFALFFTILEQAFGDFKYLWTPVVAFVAVISIILGAFAALFQAKLKRIIAYSTISHMGFVALGFLGFSYFSYDAIFSYLLIYVIMTLGAFAFLLSIRRRGELLETVADLTGLSKDRPLLALCFTILLFSFAGVPPFAGFFAKLTVLQSAIEGQHIVVSVIAVLASVVSAAFYIRIIKAMYFDKPVGGEHTLHIDRAIPRQTYALLIASTLFVVFYVFAPNTFTMNLMQYLPAQ